MLGSKLGNVSRFKPSSCGANDSCSKLLSASLLFPQLLKADYSCAVDLVVELGLYWDARRPAWDWLLFEAVLLCCSCGRSPALRLLAAAHPLPRVLVFPVQPRLVRSKDGNGRVWILLDPLQRLPRLRQEGWWGDLRARVE